ncbi:hypothetical protein QVD17_42130 [Tagetes erecta]|uniref:Syringolide-induced protein 14-1-1 n=1 Tax=Tagetes erecta TaxID=13708 RepID=A0AAD8JN28_TARER|nr:hypothetical protein QVD17_42130 [Tagetes erecta]
MDQQHKAPTTTKSKNTILKYLPKPTSSVSFQNPSIYSPARDKIKSSDKPHKSNLGIGFSGPMVSMILADSRRNFKNRSDHNVGYEPTSPRVSCMGQVKCKNKKPKPQLLSKNKVLQEAKSDDKSKKKLGFKNIFSGVTPRTKDSRKKDSTGPVTLSTMKRFSSGRDKFSGIDWTKEVAVMNSGDRRYDSDEESDDERVVVPSSAPVFIRNTLGFEDDVIRVGEIKREPRNEINLWKRRTMQQPKPLQLHSV